MSLARYCGPCSHRLPEVGGIAICQASGRDSLEHVRAATCPRGRFTPEHLRRLQLEVELEAAGYGPDHPAWPGNSPCCH